MSTPPPPIALLFPTRNRSDFVSSLPKGPSELTREPAQEPSSRSFTFLPSCQLLTQTFEYLCARAPHQPRHDAIVFAGRPGVLEKVGRHNRIHIWILVDYYKCATGIFLPPGTVAAACDNVHEIALRDLSPRSGLCSRDTPQVGSCCWRYTLLC